MNCDMEKVVCFLGCRGLRESCLYPHPPLAPQRFPFQQSFLFFPFVPHDCLSATRFNSMLVLYKVRNGGLRYCFFCNESERCKKNKKKQPVHTLKPYEQRNYFLLLVSPLV